MNLNVLEVLEPGLSATLQDRGRSGWRRFGVPPSGAMDDHAAGWANKLLDNPPDAPVIELLFQGASLRWLQTVWVAVTGADAQANVLAWRAIRARAGEVMEFRRNRSGVWIYIAVEGGFEGRRFLGSASVYPRGNLGRPFARGDLVRRNSESEFQLPPTVAGRLVAPDERRDYDSPPLLRVWPAPQAERFSAGDRDLFFSREWTVTSQSDRAGYRLAGSPLKSRLPQIISEPVRVGTVQVPENGLPIVTLHDGPTVGGYPKLGLIDPADVSWLAQCRPGQKVRFRPAR